MFHIRLKYGMRNHIKYSENPYKYADLMLGIDETKVLSELSKTSLRLYLYIRERSVRVKDVLYFEIKESKKYCNFKQDKSVYNALSELINNNILAGREKHDEFYFNPKFINEEKEL